MTVGVGPDIVKMTSNVPNKFWKFYIMSPFSSRLAGFLFYLISGPNSSLSYLV